MLSSLPPLLAAQSNGSALELHPSGSWTAAHVAAMENLLKAAKPQLQHATAITVDLVDVQELDTLGAWLIEKIAHRTSHLILSAAIIGVADNYAGLINEVSKVNRTKPKQLPQPNPIAAKLDHLGRATLSATDDVAAFLQMLGALCVATLHVLRRLPTLRLTSLTYQFYCVCWQAIPIVVLITFLIGAIIAQQGIFHFRKFGADSYVVDMVGILVLRELGVLIVAIMVAGRSGSAYTAELGSMKMREEIDALSTMGLDPIDILILPRIVALICALPILTFIGSMAALYGGGLVAWFYGGMSPTIFIARLHEAVSVTSFEVGMIKAPFMALVIGIVACSEGLQVKGSAESLGKRTTSSVVKSIFLVIVLDGLFAIFFASVGM